MKVRLKYGLLTALVLFVLGLAGGIVWLFDTPDGARWLFAQVSRSTSIKIQAKTLEGTLARGVRIEGLSVTMPDTAVEIKEFKLRWQPAELFFGRIRLDELSASEIRVQDNRPETGAPPPLAVPRPGGLFRHLNVRIDRMDLEDLIYRRLAAEPFVVNRMSAALRLSHGTLSLRNVLIRTPQAGLDGTAVAGFVRPSLRLDAAIVPAAPVSGIDRAILTADLKQGRKPDELLGPITLTALYHSQKTADLRAELETAPDSVRITGLRISRPGFEGIVSGRVYVLLTGKKPAVDAALELENMDLSDQTPSLRGIRGKLDVSGTTESYRGVLALSKKGAGMQSGRLEANFSGTPEELSLSSLRGNWLGGSIDGSARATWKKALSAEASVKVRHLDPAMVSSDWTGTLNADLSAAVVIKNKKPFASLSLRLLQSRLQDRTLTGMLKARVRGEDILLQRLVLQGSGFSVKASGSLAERIDIALRFSDLSLLMPDYEGTVAASGWVRKRKGVISGSVTGRGKDLLAKEARASELELRASVEDREGYPFAFSLALRNAGYSMAHADSIDIDASGTLKSHKLDASLRSSVYSVKTRITGGYDQGVWKGAIIRLTGTEQREQLSMQAPADVTVSRAGATISPIVITAAGDQRIVLAGSMTKQPLSGSLTADWSGIDISRLNAWMTGIAVSGQTKGHIAAKVLPDQKLEVTGSASLSRANLRRGFEQGELKADIDKAELSLLWREQTLEGNASLVFAKYGRVDAGIRAALPARLPLAVNRDGQVRAFVKGQIRESGTLSFLFPGLIQESRGQANVDIRVTGTWNDPDPSGTFDLQQAGGYLPAAGIHVSDVQMKARINRNGIRVESMKATSGKGTIEGKAEVTLAGLKVERYHGTLQGDKFQALFLPQTRMVVSPKIEFDGSPEKLSVRGEVKVPELLIYGPPKEAPLQPSEDVVIVSGQPEAGQAPALAMDIQVKLVLGDRVIVKTAGADAQLGGEVMLVIRTLQDVRGRGEISVKKGKYSTYGVSLDIERGRVLFGGGPIENPGLDILAVKTVNDVKAGVIVTGTLKKPIVKLYSQPAMPDADVLAYMVLGHPLGQDKEQSSYVMQAAGALLSASQSVALQDQVKQRLGLDTIDVESGSGTVSRSLVTIGKYLSSKLYVSYGRALFTGENLFRMRYKFAKRWELESHSGETSGLDLYYTIQFD